MLTDDAYAELLGAELKAATSDVEAPASWGIAVRDGVRRRRRDQAWATAVAAVVVVAGAAVAVASGPHHEPRPAKGIVMAGFDSPALRGELDQLDMPCVSHRPPNDGETPDNATSGMWAAYQASVDDRTGCQVAQGDDTFTLPSGLGRERVDGQDVFLAPAHDGFRVGYVRARYDFEGKPVWIRVYVDDSAPEESLAKLLVVTRANTMVRIVPMPSLSRSR